MKNIQAQYQDLLEGKMSKANFMRNVRMQFPQHISPVTSYDDSIKILKGKRILSETKIEELSPQTRYNAMMKADAIKRDQNKKRLEDPENYSQSKEEDALDKSLKFEKHISPTTRKKVEDFAKKLNLKVEIKKTSIADDNYKPRITLSFLANSGQSELVKVHITKTSDTMEGRLPGGEESRKALKNIIAQIKKEELNVEPSETRLNEESLTVNGKTVKKYVPNGDKSYSIEYDDGTVDRIAVSNDDWDIINNHHQSIVKNYGSINEAKQLEGVYKHNPNAEDDLYRGIDHLNVYVADRAIKYELSKMPEITDENYVKARKKVVAKMLKDPDAYKELMIANYDEIKKRDENLKMKEYKKVGNVDKANELKVVKKDAPASANHVTKEVKKKEKVTQMTQTPKGKLEAFPTPGKEKVMALKEHLLEDLTSSNDNYEEIGKGSRVKKKSLKAYDEAGVGNVEDFDGHTALVKWDNGETEHVQKNILTKKEIPQHPKAAEKFGKIPDSPFMKKEELQSEDSEKEASLLEKIKAKLVKAIDKIKKEGAIAKTNTGVTVDVGRNDSEVQKTARSMKNALGQPITVTDTNTGRQTKI